MVLSIVEEDEEIRIPSCVADSTMGIDLLHTDQENAVENWDLMDGLFETMMI